jgi:hypothetical protein
MARREIVPPGLPVADCYRSGPGRGARSRPFRRIISIYQRKQEAEMSVRITCFSLGLAMASWAAAAADGLVAPRAETVWPQWQARIALQTVSVVPLASSPLGDGSAAQRGLLGGSVFGDYTFAAPAFGSFRASGGLMVGTPGSTTVVSTLAGTRLGLAVGNSVASAAPVGEGVTPLPYLGLGFTGSSWRNGLAVTADVGLVAERPAAASGVGRALFGNQGMEMALRELRVSPVLKLGVSYVF